MDERFPAWLKASQNGSIGEARTKAFLLDRFWVLERSVDIDGADFLIQRRLTIRNLLDKDPPRFGVVQSKFFQGPGTTHLIPKEYLIDEAKETRKEFFLLCHHGTAGNSKTFLLTAEDILADFVETSDAKIRLPGITLLNSSKYEVTFPDLALERMERMLAQADFRKNRTFASWFLPSVNIDASNIDPIYQEPIDNWWGDIPQTFYQMRKAAQSTIDDLDDVRRLLQSIVETNDPAKALSIAEDIQSEYVVNRGIRITIPDELYDEDFHTVVLQHREKVEQLRTAGILDNFINLKRMICSVVAEELSKVMPLDKDTVLQLRIEYDLVALNPHSITTAISPATEFSKEPNRLDKWGRVDLPSHLWFESVVPGNIVFCCAPGRYSCVNKSAELNWKSFLLERGFPGDTRIMDLIYSMRFGEDIDWILQSCT